MGAAHRRRILQCGWPSSFLGNGDASLARVGRESRQLRQSKICGVQRFSSAAKAFSLLSLYRRHKCPFGSFASLSLSGQALLHPVGENINAGIDQSRWERRFFPITAMSRDHGDAGDPQGPSLALGTCLLLLSNNLHLAPVVLHLVAAIQTHHVVAGRRRWRFPAARVHAAACRL